MGKISFVSNYTLTHTHSRKRPSVHFLSPYKVLFKRNPNKIHIWLRSTPVSKIKLGTTSLAV